MSTKRSHILKWTSGTKGFTQRFLCQAKKFLALLSFLYLLGIWVRVIIIFLSSLFMKVDWLHLTCFSFVGEWILSTFEDMHLNFSKSKDWTFWRDKSWRRSALNDALSKWLKSLYWIIFGLSFAWKTFKTVNFNLWKPDKPVSWTLDEWKHFGWFV